MSISDTLSEVQSNLQEMMRKYKFKKANNQRKEATELQYDLGKCRGRLESASNDLRNTIRVQSKNIRVGIEEHRDTMLQEQILWDAAVSYLLIQDAVYAMKTIGSYDTVSHAYEMLTAAVRQIEGKKTIDKPSIFKKTKRNEYGYINSAEAIKSKETLLDTFFAELKQTGDIDACIENAAFPSDIDAERRFAASGSASAAVKGQASSDLDKYAAILGGAGGEQQKQNFEINENDLNVMSDIHPPKV